MKQILIAIVVIIGVLLVGLEVTARTVYETPYPPLINEAETFETIEGTLDLYVWARNNKDYLSYHEALGKNSAIETTFVMQQEMELWGVINHYEINNITSHGDMVRVRTFQEFLAANGNVFPNQRVDYYLYNKDGRWVIVQEGAERSVLWTKSLIWDIF